MIIIRKLKDLQGADRFGTCMSCGTGSEEDEEMMRVTLQYDVGSHMNGTSFCMCSDCMKQFREHIRGVLERGENEPLE